MPVNFQSHYDVLPNGNKLYYSDTIPSAITSGPQFFVGDLCLDLGSTSGQAVGWLCTASGSPGTWEATGSANKAIVVGPLGATAASMAFVVPTGSWVLTGVSVVASTAGGSGATVTVERLTGTTAPGSGTAQLSAAIAIGSTYTANTVTAGTLIAAPATYVGGSDRVGIVLAGTLTGLANLFVTITMKKVS